MPVNDASTLDATDLMERIGTAHAAGDLETCADAGHDLATYHARTVAKDRRVRESMDEQLEAADAVIAMFVELLTAGPRGLAVELADELRSMLDDPSIDGHDAYRSIVQTASEARSK